MSEISDLWPQIDALLRELNPLPSLAFVCLSIILLGWWLHLRQQRLYDEAQARAKQPKKAHP